MAEESSARSPVILHVEDNPGDVRLVRDALGDTFVEDRFHVVSDGAQALAFCRREGAHADAPRPDLVLLDLRLPGMHGLEVIESLKTDADLRSIPVVVFSATMDDADVDRVYEAGANAFVTKPVDPDAYLETVAAFQSFWLEIARLPSPAE